MKPKFKIITKKLYKPAFIVVSNYQEDNEIVNWAMIDFHKEGITRSDVGVWKIKYKGHAATA